MDWSRDATTGLILAGGRGTRMGGVDKGLQPFDGRPLVAWAVERLAPQVASSTISANRNHDAYARYGVPVHADPDDAFAGPLAGFATAFAQLTTDWLATVPCDSPLFPTDLVARLGAGVVAAGEGYRAAVACTIDEADVRGPRRLRRHGVFALLHRTLAPSLAGYLAAGERRVEQWLLAQGTVDVVFDDRDAFVNVNTLDELRGLPPIAG
jgi:molybdenum cofactor guanylyltransferase